MNIYLAGPMDSVSKEYQEEWRNKATDHLQLYGIRTLDPCRRPHDADLTSREIYELDLIDIRNSDVLLVDVRPIKKQAWGTAMEIMYAHEVLRKPIIGWHDGGELGKRIFLDATMTREFDSLNRALDHISAFYCTYPLKKN